ncbi:MAG: cation:proton antiporter [Firmicutes bacterium]|nr:cation:proton antiporter [Bacillota bacterium]
MVTAPFFVFSVVFVVAFVIPYLSLAIPSLRMPTAILEIVCGILLGKSGLQFVLPPQWIGVITKLGLLYLMFLAGLEIRTSSAADLPGQGSKRQQVALASVHFAMTLALSLLAGHLLARFGMATSPLFIGLMLATTSLGVVVPILKETGLIVSDLGQTLLLAALFADFGTVALVPFTLHTQGTQAGNPLWTLAWLGVLGVALYLAGRLLLRTQVLRSRAARTQQLGVRGALAIMGISAAVSQSQGGGVILGGFVAGLVCSLLAGRAHEGLRRKLEVLGYSFFLPLFFVTVGLNMDLSHIHFQQMVTWLPAYLAVAFAVKLLATLTFRPWYRGRVVLAAGALMSTRFTLVIAVALTAAASGVISGTEEGVLIATALVTVIVSPLAFTALMPKNPDQPM